MKPDTALPLSGGSVATGAPGHAQPGLGVRLWFLRLFRRGIGGGCGRRRADERGVALVVVVLLALAILAVAGLVIDNGYALGAKRQAMNEAEQAARAGSDALNQGDLRSGIVQVDPNQAITAAQNYLHAVGATGTVTINGSQVTVTAHQRTTILSAVGVDAITVQATATAQSIDQNAP